jgi:FMN phosphatase YigB (HAD superfamily)
VRINTIFFELHDTLIDSQQLGRQQRAAVATRLVERHGGTQEEWLAAYEAIRADWRSYWADLDTSGDDGRADYEEGQWRITRALFRLTGREYPPQDEIHWHVHHLPALAARQCNVLHPDARTCVDQLNNKAYILGLVTGTLSAVAQGLLRGSAVTDQFTGPIVGIDQVGRAGKPIRAYQTAIMQAGAEPGACLVVDNGPGVAGAKAAGMRAVLVQRHEQFSSPAVERARAAADLILPDLIKLPDWLEQQAEDA